MKYTLTYEVEGIRIIIVCTEENYKAMAEMLQAMTKSLTPNTKLPF